MANHVFSKEETERAKAKSQQMRSERKLLRKRLKSGEISVEDVIRDKDNMVIGRMRVKYLLESLPQIWKIRAAQIMEEIGIDENRLVRGLGKHQVEELLSRVKK